MTDPPLKWHGVNEMITDEQVDEAIRRLKIAFRRTEMTTRYPWHLAPPEAEWAATDENGAQHFFTKEPTPERTSWCPQNGYIERIQKVAPDWRESLERRPQKKKRKAWRRLYHSVEQVQPRYAVSVVGPDDGVFAEWYDNWLGPVEEFEYEEPK